MMRMFSNGLRASKSGSLLIMAFASPLRASSRNISSFGSRHLDTLITSLSSKYTGSDVMSVPSSRTLSKDLSANDPLKRAALISTLVSKIKFNYFSLRSCSSNSGVMPCFWAYSLMSSITCRRFLLSSNKRLIISTKLLFSFSLNIAKRSANSSVVSMVIVFILQI